jgi:ubiquinone/menaquinone biosynthesis C-methylase UbiE
MQKEQAPQKARVSQHEVAALYDKLAGFYDIWGHLTETRARNRALELANVKPGENVLEVAVGTGLAFVHVIRGNPKGRNVGIDISEGMISKAEQRFRKAGLTNYELSVGSALAIQEKANTFDVLLNNYMFDLLDASEWARVLTEYHRVIKPEGRLILVNMTFGEKWGSGIYERLYRLSPSLMGGCRGVRLSGVLQQNGFSVRLREYFQQLLFPSEVIMALKIITK